MQRNPARYRVRSRNAVFQGLYTYTYRYYDDSGEFIYEESHGGDNDWGYASSEQSCSDAVGFRTRDNPLYLSSDNYSPARIYLSNGTFVIPSGESGLYENRAEFSQRRIIEFNHAINPWDESTKDVEFVTKAAAETNPSSANIQTLVFLSELRDLPSLFQSTGRTLAKFGANEYLKFQYGWKPFVSDLRKFFMLADKVSRRLTVVNRLDSNSKLRRKYRPVSSTLVDNASQDSDIYQAVQGTPMGGLIGLHLNTQIKSTRWADVLWQAKAPDNLFPSNHGTNLERARSAVFGLNIDGPTLWQAMPWSWLIDWTTNCSEYIKSQNNVVGAEFSKAVLMKTTECTTIAEPFWLEDPPYPFSASQTFVNGRRTTLFKERILDIEPAAVQTGELDILSEDSGFKASILLALGIQRLR